MEPNDQIAGWTQAVASTGEKSCGATINPFIKVKENENLRYVLNDMINTELIAMKERFRIRCRSFGT